LLAGPQGEIETPENPTAWIAPNAWPEVYANMKGMSQLENFRGFDDYFL